MAGGVESISCVQQEMNLHMIQDLALAKQKPEIYWSMLQTAEQGGQALQHRPRSHGRIRRRQPAKACAAQAAVACSMPKSPHHRDGRCGRQDRWA